jgi:hypothetical protein
MLFWNKEKKQEKVIPARIQKMSKDEIVMWMDTSLMNFHRAYDEWRFRNGPSTVIDEHIEALSLMWAELLHREGAK